MATLVSYTKGERKEKECTYLWNAHPRRINDIDPRRIRERNHVRSEDRNVAVFLVDVQMDLVRFARAHPEDALEVCEARPPGPGDVPETPVDAGDVD
jgi:hypothetical protein